MSYALGNPFICQVHISIRSGRIFFYCCILVLVRVFLYQIRIYLHQYYIFELFYLALWNSEYIIHTHTHSLLDVIVVNIDALKLIIYLLVLRAILKMKLTVRTIQGLSSYSK